MALGSILGDIGSGIGRGILALGTGGISEYARSQQEDRDARAQQNAAALGSILQTSSNPAEAIQKLAAMGTEDSVKLAQQLYANQSKPADAFTLGEGQRRFDASGKLIAEAPKTAETITPYQQAQLDIERQKLATSKQPTESQSNAALYASRMVDANTQLQKIMDSGFSPAIGRSYAPNWAKSEAGQLFDQAQRNFINATLRRESGAVISPDEFSNAEEQYFPVAGDTEKTLAQKAQNRARAIEGISNAAGPAQKNIPTQNTGKLSGLTSLPAGYKDIGNGQVLGPDGKKYRMQQD